MRNNEERFGATTKVDSPAPFVETNNNNNSNTLNFVVPTDFVELPSKGAFYPKEHPLHGQECIEVRQMTAKDEDILTSRALLQKGIAVERLLQNLIINKDINVSELLVGDKNAIMIATRASAYGSSYETKVQCPYCNSVNDHEFDLEQIKSKVHEPGSFSSTENGTFVIELPVSKVKVEVRFLNGKDEADLLAFSEKKKQYNLLDNPITDQMKAFTVSINALTNREEISSFIENMPAKDSHYLRTTYLGLVPNIDLTQNIKCKSCFVDIEMEVPFTTEFFWPK
tara:strand:+ start:5749 stop:6597 length:849 start_codon:yes stop_codon:yes gene_type:complete